MTKIETSFGSAAASVSTVFKLMYQDSNGNTPVQVTTWTHNANNFHKQHILGTPSTILHDKTVWIECTDGGTSAYGYTATLTWTK